MSYRVVGYDNGKPIRIDEGPSSAISSSMMFRSSEPIRETYRDPVDAPRVRHVQPDPRCVLTGRCRHQECVARRVEEVRRLHSTTNLTLAQIGQLMGGRDHSTVSYWLREYEDKAA